MASPKEIFWPQKVQNVFQILLSNFRLQIKLLKVTYAVHLYNQAIRPVWQLHCHLKERLPELKTPSNKETLRVLDWLQRQMAIFFSVDWLRCVFVCVLSQSCLTPMSSSSSGSSIHGIFQARILEWVPISYSRGSSQLRDWTFSRISRTGSGFFTTSATWETLSAPLIHSYVILNNNREVSKDLFSNLHTTHHHKRWESLGWNNVLLNEDLPLPLLLIVKKS